MRSAFISPTSIASTGVSSADASSIARTPSVAIAAPVRLTPRDVASMKISEKGEHGSGRKLHAMRLRAPAFAPARAGVLAVRPLPETFTYGAGWIAALAWDGDG